MGRSSHKDESHDREPGGNSLIVALGAVGGLALGLLLTNAAQGDAARRGAARLRDRARETARGWAGPARDAAREWVGPAPLQRPAAEEQGLARLEDAVLESFLRDPVLSERGVDVGCISPGIIELSGSVRTPAEVERAVSTARGVQGVVTVVNRMDVDDDGHRARGTADSTATEGRMSGEWTGRNVGMGQRRQGIETENRGGLDDSQHLREVALEQSDRDQYEDEGIAHEHTVMSSRPGTGDVATHYREDELDNQDPYGKHAVPAPEQPQALHSQARVGEGLPPGMELALEGEDVPVKPHSDSWVASPNESGSAER
jgi:osmotically-inducible protein OsmY